MLLCACVCLFNGVPTLRCWLALPQQCRTSSATMPMHCANGLFIHTYVCVYLAVGKLNNSRYECVRLKVHFLLSKLHKE